MHANFSKSISEQKWQLTILKPINSQYRGNTLLVPKMYLQGQSPGHPAGKGHPQTFPSGCPEVK